MEILKPHQLSKNAHMVHKILETQTSTNDGEMQKWVSYDVCEWKWGKYDVSMVKGEFVHQRSVFHFWEWNCVNKLSHIFLLSTYFLHVFERILKILSGPFAVTNKDSEKSTMLRISLPANQWRDIHSSSLLWFWEKILKTFKNNCQNWITL